SPSRFEDNSILVGFVNTPLYVKVSARCSPKLARRGFHLGQAVGKAAAAVEGEGGGHSTAAGAQIPLRTEEAFLEALSREARE
ncbi:MAG: DHH family phosphoesterase, partial [Candidatus Verstraetearchaeota archaeon]|nr:DHH family phosphoesterase [Candidatus Verstraetearchaeota archaeon]